MSVNHVVVLCSNPDHYFNEISKKFYHGKTARWLSSVDAVFADSGSCELLVDLLNTKREDRDLMYFHCKNNSIEYMSNTLYVTNDND